MYVDGVKEKDVSPKEIENYDEANGRFFEINTRPPDARYRVYVYPEKNIPSVY